MKSPALPAEKRRIRRLLAALALTVLPLVGTTSPAAAESVVYVAAQNTNIATIETSNHDVFAASDATKIPRAGETDFLPAWRWQNLDLDQDSGGLLGAIKTMPNAIALILFAFANFLWQVLLNITKLGLSADFITPAAPAINAGVAQLGEMVFIFGAVILAVVFWKGVKIIFSTMRFCCSIQKAVRG